MASSKQITFTPREMEVLALAWQCMETQPKIDIPKLAQLTGYTTGSASVTFGKIKSKIKSLGDSLSENGPAVTPKKPAKPSPKSTPKRKTTINDNASTPSKRAKKTPARGADEEDDNDDDDDDDIAALVKKEESVDNESCAFLGSSVRGECVKVEEGRKASYGFLDGIERFARP
ncbi:hypothetical protein BDW02DRAFT_650259 [Decorospora gaudefroyi]|uniref:Uncharacterized protein n=1 Tax=Decorospora gaudefroyi TaxID=184978 RepID=A0A6A5K0X9_9PLEO|nr:hypothetical protein BDW02DRAFT_650259 [Decorospora gaudefroyi]